MVYIIEFIEYTVSRGWLDSDLAGDVSVAARRAARPSRPIDQDALAHIRKGAGQSGPGHTRKLLPKVSQNETVRVLRMEELAALLRWAGPRPSQRKEGDGGCDRDRIVLDLAWAVGLRVDEISRLRIYPFEVMTPNSQYAGELFKLSVTGKGGKTRIVDVPAWLVIDIQTYTRHERRRSLRRRGPNASESQLVLNSESSRNRVGRPMTVNGMQALMARACTGAGLMQRIERTNPETQEVAIKSVPRFSLHCLRHTYAVMTYRNHKVSGIGDFEAWKYVQMQLGHASPITTMNIYLRHVTAWSDMRTSHTLLEMLGA